MDMAPSPNQKNTKPGDSFRDLNGLEMPQHIINADSDVDSDSDGSNEGWHDPDSMGYELLPQDPEPSAEEDRLSSPNDRTQQVAQTLHTDRVERELWRTLEPGSGFVPMASGSNMFPDNPRKSDETEERCKIWNLSKRSKSEMQPDEADTIKKAMSGFSLPDSSIPSWASALKEEDWKAQLIKKLQKD